VAYILELLLITIQLRDNVSTSTPQTSTKFVCSRSPLFSSTNISICASTSATTSVTICAPICASTNATTSATKVAITYKMELRSQTQNIIFAPQSVLESDFRRKDGNLEFKFNDPILGNLNLSLNWNRSGWKHFRHKIPTAWTNFDKLYLQKKLLVIKNRGVISHKCIRYGSTIDPELEGDYVPVSLSDGAKRSSTNWHQLQLYVNGGNISGHQNGEYFIVSHLCHHRNCVGDANDPKKVHLSFEPQKVNLSRQACVKKHKKDPNYCCPGHDYDENLYPKCIF